MSACEKFWLLRKQNCRSLCPVSKIGKGNPHSQTEEIKELQKIIKTKLPRK